MLTFPTRNSHLYQLVQLQIGEDRFIFLPEASHFARISELTVLFDRTDTFLASPKKV